MKNKSVRHKNENTFKFLPFSERIGGIDVDVFHKVQHEYTTQDEENETFFYQTLSKWEVLNLCQSYESFQKEIRPFNFVTLPQLLLVKDNIFQILLKYIKDGDLLSLQPLLELVVALARDLQKEFHNYFPETFETLINLLNTKNTEQLEWVFTCLAYLFKFLWRSLVKDINSVFNALLPLLSDNKPEYINSFAAESFAFVARRVKDKKIFLELLLKSVKNKPDGIPGCGKLLFQVINGIEGQFHSCAETMLPFLLKALSEKGPFQNILFDILDTVISNVVAQIHPQKGDLLWSTYIHILKNLLEIPMEPSSPVTSINLILQLIGHTIEYKEGRFLQKPSLLIEVLIEILNSFNQSEDTLLLVCQISILLLSSKNIKLSQEQASIITRKLLNISNKKVFLYFVDNIKKYSSFEALILPNFLRYCVKSELDAESFYLLTKIVVNKSIPCINGINLPKWVKYNLDFKEANSLIMDTLTRLIKQDNTNILKNFDDFYCSLVCLPHLIPKANEELLLILEEKVIYFIKSLTGDHNDEYIKKILFLINISLECLLHLETPTERVFKLSIENAFDLMLPLTDKPEYINSLQTISMIISFLKKDESFLSMDLLLKINAVMEKNFSSPFKEVRLLTAFIYAAFEHLPDFKLKHSTDPEAHTEQWKVFSLIYNVESIESHVNTYRDQLQSLDKLSFDKPQMLMCNQTTFKMIPLRYLCGTLYINFQLLWDPVIKIIASHATGMPANTFWEIFGEQLRNSPKDIIVPKVYNVSIVKTSCEILGDSFQNLQMLSSKIDFANYRLLLWRALVSFAYIAEAKTRDVSELLLTFLSTEYIIGNDTLPTQSIKQNSLVVEDVYLNEDKESKSLEKNETNKSGNRSAKILIKTLVQKLTVFAQFRSPLSVFREPELYKLYFDLLQHKDSNIQKIALDCIFTYKHKYLTPYKENIYNLIDDKNFKQEITTFSVDKDSSVILSEHRDGLIPIVMQIVFGKMNIKTGLRTGGKSSGQSRRSIVFRFLAGCQEKELLTFLQKVLRLYNKFIQDDPIDTVELVYKDANLETFLLPKKLLSTLNVLQVIYEQCGGLMTNEILSFLLKILFVIGSFIRFAFDNISEVHAGYLSVLRNLRVSCIKIIGKFFEHFDSYPWTGQEVNAVFSVFIWPYLEKLNTEGIHSPTALLKLIVQWGSNPRYFPLLNKHKENDSSLYILPHLLNLFTNEKSHISVINVIEEMLQKLLSLQPDEEDLKNPILVDNLLTIDKDILGKVGFIDNLNFGSMILLPHVSTILAKIQRKLLTKSKNLNTRELFILSRISELVWDPDLSDKILDLLLPVVVKKCKRSLPEEVVLKYLSSILNLIKNVDKPHVHLKQISPLFTEVTYPSGRKALCQILKVMSNKTLNEEFKTNTMVIEELNAFDKKWIDQPDFERRHNTFKIIENYILEDKISLSLGILIIHNSCFFINQENDLSTRENSSHCLKKVSAYLTRKYPKQVDLILNNTLFNLIRSGLKNPKQNIRNEYISLLGHLARECPDAHFILRDLNKYANKTDLEVDFFENLIHLQIHRHARALLKFCQVTREQTEAPNPRTLTQFILPLISHYLCKESFAGKNSVIDAAIESIGVVCRVLPWHQYEGMLKYYLMRMRSKLEFQKQLVRLIVTILDAFHFDLKNAHANNEIQKYAEELINVQDDINGKNIEEGNNSKELEENEIAEPEIDDFVGNEDNDDEEEEVVSEEKIRIVEKISVLCKSTATRVVRTLQLVLIPKLHKSLAEMTQHESSHKINRKKLGHEREEEDLLRIPISLALVKLLQKLPEDILEHNLPGVFMKICTFLKSPLESVRRVARETLQKIMLTLGPKYLSSLLSEMSPLLGRGFQVHVLVFTIHGVLNCLKDTYQPSDLDKILLTIVNFCTADIFGALSEEKEVAKIAVKVAEARHSKSYDTFQILAQYITESCLLDLILPIKRVLETSHSFKTAHKAQEALRYIALGLVDNTFIPTESLLKFAYGTSSKSIPQLIPKVKRVKSEKEIEIQRREKEDCFLIPKVPGSRDMFRLKNVKNSANTNAHLLVEFGLRLCFVMLKRDKVKDESYKSFIDPFIGVFKNCLKSKHVKLSTLTLQCLLWVLKFDLPSLRLQIKPISKDIFGILHKYASAGLSKGDNFDLVVAAFKAMSVLVREVKYHTIDSTQLKILLLYVEQDIHNHERQATAFSLLKAILSRKINAPELNEVMEKLAELSILSELDHVRVQSRAVFHQYLMEYPLGNTLEKHLGFYISQLSYEMRSGRESAIEMIATLINSFPLEVLKSHSGTLLVTLGARLINDEEPECRKKIAECLSAMLKKMAKADRDPLFDIIVTWLKDKNTNHRRLASQICGIFVTIEKAEFETRLPILIPLLLIQFGIDNSPGKLVRVNTDEKITTEEQQRIKDHHLFQVLQLLLKICAHCPIILKQKDVIENLAVHIQSLLAYPHDWVRLGAAQFLGYVLASLEVDHLTKLIVSDESDDSGYLCNDPVNAVKSLTLDLCDQLQPKNIKSDLAEQVIKNLVFIARVLQTVPTVDNKPNLLWLAKRMRKIVNTEIVENASSAILRTEVFKWIAGVCTALELENILPIAHHLVGPLARELSTTEEKNAPLRHLAKDVSNLLKTKVGLDAYTNMLSKQQQHLSIKRAERKRSRTQLAVTNPESFAKKKIKRHEKKKEAKKRKIDSLKGTKRNFKKRKTVDLEDNSEVI